jgi:hypothetical protein
MAREKFRVRTELLAQYGWQEWTKLALVFAALPVMMSGYWFPELMNESAGLYSGFAMALVALAINEGLASPEFWEAFWSKEKPQHILDAEKKADDEAYANHLDRGGKPTPGRPDPRAAAAAAPAGDKKTTTKSKAKQRKESKKAR